MKTFSYSLYSAVLLHTHSSLGKGKRKQKLFAQSPGFNVAFPNRKFSLKNRESPRNLPSGQPEFEPGTVTVSLTRWITIKFCWRERKKKPDKISSCLRTFAVDTRYCKRVVLLAATEHFSWHQLHTTNKNGRLRTFYFASRFYTCGVGCV